MSATTTPLISPAMTSCPPIVRALSPAAESTSWKRQAVCARETSAAPELWTSDRRPTGVFRVELTRMCQRCPVRRQCAAAAIADGAECGIYAGIYVPERKRSHGSAWESAMVQLQAVVEEPEPTPLAVPA